MQYFDNCNVGLVPWAQADPKKGMEQMMKAANSGMYQAHYAIGQVRLQEKVKPQTILFT